MQSKQCIQDQGGNDTITWQPSYEEEAVHLWKPNVLLGSLICLVAYLAWEQISFQLARYLADCTICQCVN